ncbi:hypothetical protein AB0H43_01555 [Hamadaea sp. NPDC050747]|uniref:hypothetical protein n=1 Tax=Hamadaea sp. NPDC050747 TaxID=3155789 RepID=UPI00340F0C28
MVDCRPDQASVTWGAKSTVKVLTGAKQLEISSSGERSVGVVRPEARLVAEVANGPREEEWVRWLLAQANKDLGIPVDEAKSPPLSGVDSFLDNVKVPGRYIGFVGVGELTLPFTVTCAGQSAIMGDVHAWDNSTTGILQCSRTPEPGSFSELAKKNYCC